MSLWSLYAWRCKWIIPKTYPESIRLYNSFTTTEHLDSLWNLFNNIWMNFISRNNSASNYTYCLEEYFAFLEMLNSFEEPFFFWKPILLICKQNSSLIKALYILACYFHKLIEIFKNIYICTITSDMVPTKEWLVD